MSAVPPDPYATPAARITPSPTKPPWNPTAIGMISFFLSFLPGGIMLALNYERLGEPDRKLPTLVAVFIGFVLLIFVTIVLPDDSPFDRVINFVNIGVAIAFSRLQKEAFEKHMEEGGKKASPWPIVGISLGVIVALGVAFIWMLQDIQ